MEPNPKDFAEFALLGIRFRILTPAAVVAWADGIIAQADIPAAWVIELAMATANTIEDELKRVPGESQIGLSLHLLLALIFRRWRAGRLTINEVRSIGWFLHCESALPKPKGNGDWGVCLEYECDGRDEGWRTEDELRKSIDEKLAGYSSIEWMLPSWTEYDQNDRQ